MDLPVCPFCPVCNLDLSNHDQPAANHHVNRCLDGGYDAVAVADKQLENNQVQDKRLSPSPTPPPPPAKKKKISAFNVLMSSNNPEEKADAEADAQSQPRQPRQPPFYKILQGMPIAVDAFAYSSIPNITAYFLTHAHSDHYQSLSKNWSGGPIYCSEITAELVHHITSVKREYLRPLSLNTAHTIPGTNGVTATLIDANHCPGSCIIVFEGRQTVDAAPSTFTSPWIGSSRSFKYLHCGDFRASPRHIRHPAIARSKFDIIYLDTTYLNPTYSFPPQPLVIDACRDLVLANLRGEMRVNSLMQPNSSMLDMIKGGWKKLSGAPEQDEHGEYVTDEKPSSGENKSENENIHPHTLPNDVLVVVGTYSIGKERIVKAIAHALNSKVYADKRRQALLRNERDSDLDALLTSDPYAAQVHIQGLGGVTIAALPDYISRFNGRFSRVIGIKPTGWTYSGGGRGGKSESSSGSGSASDSKSPSIDLLLKQDLSRWDTYTHKHIHSTRGSNDYVSCYGVPYSEHSSFTELTCFALSIDHTRIIATVNNAKPASRLRMKNWFDAWLLERRKRCERGEYSVEARSENFW
ncbi:DNA cross-link repair 1A protein [Wallemia ichthyophaga EXF-994]|uniref:DNA cross-link repair 1A protein n=1 Tax=Wallemia ichthyophaga (strain EXF-994 / CBS 113033) TaxID=1299270 RepID=R9ALG6_WALI9|nr:DNA cross-link repair 1A protein [Wallemia ichthyophaga EXF-994]EOR00901.1 DNA cross-link repair 1A protein [Wallemia ichthyophaga EXF-994]